MGTHRPLGFALALVLVAAACSSAATPTPAPAIPAPATPAPASAAAPASVAPATATPLPFAGQTVRIAHAQPGSFDDVQLGYWLQQLKDKYGIDAQFTSVASGDVALRAVVAGSNDVSVALSPAALIQLVKNTGSDVKLIAVDAAASDDVLVAKASIASVADLAGKTMGYSAPGAESDLIPHLCLNAQGFTYSSLKVVKIGGTSARMAALLAGQIDVSAAHSADAAAAVAKSNGALKILLDCGKSLGNYPQTGMVASGAWLKANPQLAQALVDAYLDANRWAASSKDAYIAAAATWIPDMAAADMPAAYDVLKSLNFWPVNGGVDIPSLETYVGNAAQVGILTGKIPTTDQWVDASFVNNYLQRNGSQ